MYKYEGEMTTIHGSTAIEKTNQTFTNSLNEMQRNMKIKNIYEGL